MSVIESEFVNHFIIELGEKVIAFANEKIGEQSNTENLKYELLTPKEASNYLGLSIPTLNKLAQDVIRKYHFEGTRKVYYKKRELFEALVPQGRKKINGVR